MKVTLNIPDDLVPVVVRILEEQSYRNDEMVDLCIMRQFNIIAETFVRADHIVSEIHNEIREQAAAQG